jgi:hypothetical protein
LRRFHLRRRRSLISAQGLDRSRRGDKVARTRSAGGAEYGSQTRSAGGAEYGSQGQGRAKRVRSPWIAKLRIAGPEGRQNIAAGMSVAPPGLGRFFEWNR